MGWIYWLGISEGINNKNFRNVHTDAKHAKRFLEEEGHYTCIKQTGKSTIHVKLIAQDTSTLEKEWRRVEKEE